jgi:hypothetical protein
MPDANREETQTTCQQPVDESADAEPIEDEEKILAGRIDVNLPALLTKDVQGG